MIVLSEIANCCSMGLIVSWQIACWWSFLWMIVLSEIAYWWMLLLTIVFFRRSTISWPFFSADDSGNIMFMGDSFIGYHRSSIIFWPFYRKMLIDNISSQLFFADCFFMIVLMNIFYQKLHVMIVFVDDFAQVFFLLIVFIDNCFVDNR